MKRLMQLNIVVLLLVIVLGLGQACTPAFMPVDSEASNSSLVSETCSPPTGVSGSPKTIEDITRLINSLPKPLSVACFLKSLDRPLNVSLTSNTISAQPSGGSRSPRIFIMIDKLFISVVPEGPGRDVLEASFLTQSDMSIKAEFDFPVVSSIPFSAPYEKIRYGNGTACAACHTRERPATQVTFASAFESIPLRPNDSTLVSVESFRQEVQFCDRTSEPERCEIIDAFFGGGEVKEKAFPPEMLSF